MVLAKPDLVLWKRRLTLWSRTTMVNGGIVEWDVVGKQQKHVGPNCVCIFPYHSEDGTVSIIREYHQGTDEYKYGLPAGYYEPGKHVDLVDAAKHELSEECHLKDGRWYNLLPEGYSELKWVTHKVVPFLVIDPVVDEFPKPLDDFECINIYRVPVDSLMDYISMGSFTLTSLQTTVMSLHKLGRLVIQ